MNALISSNLILKSQSLDLRKRLIRFLKL